MATPYFNASVYDQSPVVVQGQEVKNVNFGGGMNSNENEWTKGEKQAKQCRDVPWAILFYLHLGIMGYCAGVYSPLMSSTLAEGYAAGGDGGRRLLQQGIGSFRFLEEQNADGDETVDINLSGLMSVLVMTGLSGFILSTLALGVMMQFAETLIKAGLIGNLILAGLGGLASLLAGEPMGALLGLLMFALLAYYTCMIWSRIPFAASNLVTAVTSVRANLGLAFYAYLSLFLMFGWAICWAISTASALFVINGCDAEGQCNQETSGILMFFFFLSYYWTVQVISNVVHVTVAGTVATWWFTPHEAQSCCSQAVQDSYFRSLTYSFGSICFGSLIVAILQATREMIHSMRENGDSLLACCAECLLSCIESLVEYFNKWAFVFVGIYGYGFMEAGKNVMSLFRSRGWTTIITDSLVDRALLIVSLLVGLLNGILALLVGAALDIGDSVPLLVPFLMGLVIGLALCTTLFSVVGSAANTVIVCYAEAPAEFQQNHPMLSNQMRESWKQAWPIETANY